MSGLTLELARLTRTSETYTGHGENEVEFSINRLVLDSRELDRSFEPGPSTGLCSYLDKNKFDEDLQFLRLSGHCSESPPWEGIKNRCKLANLSQSFYRCISVDDGDLTKQWLRTVIQQQKPKSDFIEIHSNVVPTKTYLTRLQDMQASCQGHQCTGGFFPTSVGEPPLQSCASCALAEELKGSSHMSAARGGFWELATTDICPVGDHDCLGQGSEGDVKKILWRKGVFARKRFIFEDSQHENINLNRELDVALSVSHPNIVHCFGCLRWAPDSAGYCDLFMEMLEGDLQKTIVEGTRVEDPLSFRDLLDVLLQIAEAMKHLHEKEFVHGDLKSSNILVSKLAMPHRDFKFYLIKVADFGCTQRVDSSRTFQCGLGTLHYTAPEIFKYRQKREKALVPKHPQKIDVYSFGVVAYQVLTGVTELYMDRKKSGNTLAKQVIDGLRPDFNLHRGTLDGDRSSLLPLIQRCWISNPEDRPSFSQICAELDGHLVKHDRKLRQKNGMLPMFLQPYCTQTSFHSLLAFLSSFSEKLLILHVASGTENTGNCINTSNYNAAAFFSYHFIQRIGEWLAICSNALASEYRRSQ